MNENSRSIQRRLAIQIDEPIPIFVPKPTLWVVGEFCDTMHERDAKKVRKDEEEHLRRYKRSMLIFESRFEALNFMVERAQGQLMKAQTEMKSVQKRIAKLKKQIDGCAFTTTMNSEADIRAGIES